MTFSRKLFTLACVSLFTMLAVHAVSRAASAVTEPESVTTEPEAATTQPVATSQPAKVADPNWIGPNSWQRHFTIPPFVETARGIEIPVATSRPASTYTYTTFFGGARSGKSSSTGESTTRTQSSSRSTRSSSTSSGSRSRSSSRSTSHSSSHSSRSSKPR